MHNIAERRRQCGNRGTEVAPASACGRLLLRARRPAISAAALYADDGTYEDVLRRSDQTDYNKDLRVKVDVRQTDAVNALRTSGIRVYDAPGHVHEAPVDR